MKPLQHFWSSSLVVLAALVGCNLHSGSGLDPDEFVEGGASGNNGGSGSGGSGGGSGNGSGGGSGNGSGGGSGSSSGGITNCPTNDPTACLDCCGSQDPGSYQSFENALANCVCNPGGCASECGAEVCSGKPFSSASDPCMQCVMGTTCFQQVKQQCTSDPTCQQFEQCYSACPEASIGPADAGPPPQDSGSGTNPGECPANPSTCVDCCGAFDPAGYQAFLNDLAPCLCGDGNGDVCSAECAGEVCVDQPYSKMGDACETCVNTNGARGTTCFMQARQACQNAGTCTMFMGCYGACPPGAQ